MQHKFVKAKDFFNSIKETVYLYKNIWKEGTTALLHAPRDVDKTAKAIEIATDLAAAGREVLYINVDDRLETAMTEYVENLYIFKPQFEWPDDEIDYADLVFGAIEQAVSDTHIRTFVIDSVSRIAALSFGKNASAAYIMKRLVVMQMRYKISILAVAHDTTKSANNALLTLAASEINVEADITDTTKDADGQQPAVTNYKSDNKSIANNLITSNDQSGRIDDGKVSQYRK